MQVKIRRDTDMTREGFWSSIRHPAFEKHVFFSMMKWIHHKWMKCFVLVSRITNYIFFYHTFLLTIAWMVSGVKLYCDLIMKNNYFLFGTIQQTQIENRKKFPILKLNLWISAFSRCSKRSVCLNVTLRQQQYGTPHGTVASMYFII